MDQNYIHIEDEEEEVDLGELFFYFYRRIILIIVVSSLFGIGAGIYTKYLVPKEYSSVAEVYLVPRIINDKYSASDMLANYYMIDNYVEMIEGNNICTQVANQLNIDVGTVSDALSAEALEGTEIIRIKALTTDSKVSKEIVDATVDVFIQEMSDTFGITNISVINNAVAATSPVKSSLKKNVLLGAGVGFIFIISVYFIKFLTDSHVHNKEDAELLFGIPNFGVIPDFKG